MLMGSAQMVPRESRIHRMVTDEFGKKEIVVDCLFGKTPALGVVLDSGAQDTVMSRQFYNRHRDQLGPLNKAAAQNVRIESIAGDNLKPDGTIRVAITFCDEKQKINLRRRPRR